MENTINISLTYTLGSGATYNGIPMLKLSKGDTPVTDINLLNAIRNAESAFKMKGKIICFVLDSTLSPEETAILSNVFYALSDWIKIGEIHEAFMSPLMKDLNYLIAVVSEYWAKYKANEVWYEPAEAPKEELDIGELNVQAAKFIKPTNIKLQEALSYISSSSFLYGILRETKKPLEVSIL